MNKIIHEILEKEIGNFDKQAVKMILDGKTISDISIRLKEKLDNIGLEYCKYILEAADEAVRDNPNRIIEWVIERSNDEKELLTVFGALRYTRTYYKSKKGKGYSYLSDEMLGIEPHDRVDDAVKVKIIKEAIESSYKKGGTEAAQGEDLSNQSVMNTLRELGDIPNVEINNCDKKKLKVLYVEADEDHVSLQKGGTVMPYLVYVHEGYEEQQGMSKRKKLKNVRYFGGMYDRSEELWVEVLDYITEAYDIDSLEVVYVSGDGAKWIKQGLKWLPKSKFVLDRYHLNKYILAATGEKPEMRFEIWSAINICDKNYIKEIFKDLHESAEKESKKETIRRVYSYIMHNWAGIEIYQTDEGKIVGCSAEGHVSHVYSSRLSSRPLGWSEQGTDQMSRLRVYSQNGGDIYNLVCKQRIAEKEVKITAKIRQTLIKGIKKKVYQNAVAPTIIKMGKKTEIYEQLKNILYA